MKQLRHWGYSEDEMLAGKPHRLVRYIAFTTKTGFIKAIRTAKGYHQTTDNWIAQRMAPTGNDTELKLLAKYPDKLLKIDNLTNEVLEIYELS